MAGPKAGTPKATLCQMALDCIHQTHCYSPTSEPDCYCGKGVSTVTCQQTTFKPMGACVEILQAAYESTQNAVVIL